MGGASRARVAAKVSTKWSCAPWWKGSPDTNTSMRRSCPGVCHCTGRWLLLPYKSARESSLVPPLSSSAFLSVRTPPGSGRKCPGQFRTRSCLRQPAWEPQPLEHQSAEMFWQQPGLCTSPVFWNAIPLACELKHTSQRHSSTHDSINNINHSLQPAPDVQNRCRSQSRLINTRAPSAVSAKFLQAFPIEECETVQSLERRRTLNMEWDHLPD